MGCSITKRDMEACQVRNLGDTSQTHIHGSREIRQQIMLNKKWRQKSSILSTSANGPSQQRCWSTTNESSWWAYTFSTPGMPTITSKKCTEKWEAHEFQQKVYTDCWRKLQRWIGTRIRSWAYQRWPGHTQWRKQKRRLAEAHDIQKYVWKTNDLQISTRNWEANQLHHDQEKTPEIQQRCWSQRRDSHGQRPQMCHGYIRDRYMKQAKTSSEQQPKTNGHKGRRRRIHVGTTIPRYQWKDKRKTEATDPDLKRGKEKTAEKTEAEARKKNEKKAVAQSKKSGSRSGFKRSRWRAPRTSHFNRRGGRLCRCPSQERHGCGSDDRRGDRDRERRSPWNDSQRDLEEYAVRK